MKFIFFSIFFITLSLADSAQTSFTKVDFRNSKNGLADYCYEYVFSYTDGQANQDSINVLIYRQIFEDLHFPDSSVIHSCETATKEAKAYLNDKASYEINHNNNGQYHVMSVFTDKKGIKSATLIWPFAGNFKGERKNFILSGGYDKNGNIFDKYIAQE